MDELETRLTEIKLELFNNYKRTVKKLSNIFQNEEEYNDHDYIDNTIESQNIGETEVRNATQSLIKFNQLLYIYIVCNIL